MLTHFGACPACLSHHDRLDVQLCWDGTGTFRGHCPVTGDAVMLHADGTTSLAPAAPAAPAAPVEVVEESVHDDLLVDPYFHVDD